MLLSPTADLFEIVEEVWPVIRSRKAPSLAYGSIGYLFSARGLVALSLHHRMQLLRDRRPFYHSAAILTSMALLPYRSQAGDIRNSFFSMSAISIGV